MTDNAIGETFYTDAEFETLSLHDCYVFGISWQSTKFQVTVDLDFILEWIAPLEKDGAYQFRVCQAQLRFLNVCDPKVELDWARCNLAVQIDSFLREAASPSANGTQTWKYTLQLHNPDGEITLTATGFELRCISEARVSERQSTREI